MLIECWGKNLKKKRKKRKNERVTSGTPERGSGRGAWRNHWRCPETCVWAGPCRDIRSQWDSLSPSPPRQWWLPLRLRASLQIFHVARIKVFRSVIFFSLLRWSYLLKFFFGIMQNVDNHYWTVRECVWLSFDCYFVFFN